MNRNVTIFSFPFPLSTIDRSSPSEYRILGWQNFFFLLLYNGHIRLQNRRMYICLNLSSAQMTNKKISTVSFFYFFFYFVFLVDNAPDIMEQKYIEYIQRCIQFGLFRLGQFVCKCEVQCVEIENSTITNDSNNIFSSVGRRLRFRTCALVSPFRVKDCKSTFTPNSWCTYSK
jgi:hypothetical protein